MANPERMNSNNEDFNSFSNQPDSTQPFGENHEQLNPERTRKIGHAALERYNLLNPKLERQQDAQRRTSESLANLYNEMLEGDSTRAERIAVLEREIESIGLEIESLQQQLDLARAALDELEGRAPRNPGQAPTEESNPGDNGEAPTPTDNTDQPTDTPEASGENSNGYDHTMINIETTDGPIIVVDGQVQDGRSEEAKRNNPLPPNFAEMAENGDIQGPDAVQAVDAVDYNVRRADDGNEVYDFSDGTRVIYKAPDGTQFVAPSQEEIMDATDESIAQRHHTEEWEHPVDEAEAEIIDQEVRETSEKMKEPGRFKKWAVALGLGAALLGGILSGPVGQAVSANANADLPQNTPIEQVAEAEAIPGGTYEEMNTVFDYDTAYSQAGLYASPNKPNPAAFACGDEVDALCENDDIRAFEYVTQVPETLANYVAGHIPDELKYPDDVGIDSQVELSERYDSLSNEEYDKVYQHYCDVVEHNVRVRRDTISGPYDNAYEYVKDSNSGLNRQNVELGRSVTEENNTEVIVYTFLDDNGNVIGELTVKQSCRQAVDKQGTNEKSYQGMEEKNPDQPQNYDSGNETQGNEDQGSQGNEPQNSQGQEPQDSQGAEPQPSQGYEPQPSQGYEPQPSQGYEPQPSQGYEPQPSQGEEPQETIQPKDPENLERIDENIENDIADDIGTGEVEVTPTPSEVVDAQTPTERPAGDDYEGTGPTIVENETSKEAETVTPANPENNYSEDRGGAHDDEYAPVQENTAAQEEADDNEVTSDEAPSTVEEARDTLGDLGIS